MADFSADHLPVLRLSLKRQDLIYAAEVACLISGYCYKDTTSYLYEAKRSGGIDVM